MKNLEKKVKTKAINLTQADLDKMIVNYRKGQPLDLGEFTDEYGTICYYQCEGLIFPKDVSYKGVKFTGGRFIGCHFEGRDLTAANFDRCDLTGSDFSGAIMKEVELQKTLLAGVNLTSADLQGSYCDGSSFINALCEKANFDGANINNCRFNKSNLSSASLNEALLINSILDHSICNKTKITHTQISHINCINTCFIEADFHGSSFHHSSFVNCIGFNTAKTSDTDDNVLGNCHLSNVIFFNTAISLQQLQCITHLLLIDRSTLLSLGMQPKEDSLFFSLDIGHYLNPGYQAQFFPRSKDQLIELAHTELQKKLIEEYRLPCPNFRLSNDLPVLHFSKKTLSLDGSITSYPFTFYNAPTTCTLISDIGYSTVIMLSAEILLMLSNEEAWETSKRYNGIVLQLDAGKITAFWHEGSEQKQKTKNDDNTPTFLEIYSLFNSLPEDKNHFRTNDKRFIYDVAVLFGCAPQEKTRPSKDTAPHADTHFRFQ